MLDPRDIDALENDESETLRAVASLFRAVLETERKKRRSGFVELSEPK